jgi:hypothetical protein
MRTGLTPLDMLHVQKGSRPDPTGTDAVLVKWVGGTPYSGRSTAERGAGRFETRSHGSRMCSVNRMQAAESEPTGFRAATILHNARAPNPVRGTSSSQSN